MDACTSGIKPPVGFQVLKRLGEGSEGETWLARDQALQRLVTLKRLRNDGVHSNLVSQQCSLVACAGLTHPSIARVYSATVQDNDLWLVSEYVAGMTISAPGCLSMTMVAQVIFDVAEALAGIHAANVVHCDITPSNIVVDVTGRARLLDFGIARVVGDKSTGAGTLGFIAPEILANALVASEQDAYSLGATIFWLLAGQVPEYLTDNAGERLQILPASPEGLVLPADALWHVATALVAILPDERPPIPEIIAILRDLIRGSPTRPREQLQRWVTTMNPSAVDPFLIQDSREHDFQGEDHASGFHKQKKLAFIIEKTFWTGRAAAVRQSVATALLPRIPKWRARYWWAVLLVMVLVISGALLSQPSALKLHQSRVDMQPGAKPSAHVTPSWLDEVMEGAVMSHWMLDENTSEERLQVSVRCRESWCQLMMEHGLTNDTHWHQATLPMTSAPALWRGALTDLVGIASAE